jgi:flagellar operon protein
MGGRMTDVNFLRGFSNISNNLQTNHVVKKYEPENNSVFKDILDEKFRINENDISFSKHASERIEERNIDIDETVTGKLAEAVGQAKDKGLRNILVMIDNAAFIVSARDNKVITAVKSDELKENIFTNIDGAVIK